jgi:hypothetical protein
MRASKHNNSSAYNGQTSIMTVMMNADDLIRSLVKRIVYFARLRGGATSPTHKQFWLDQITSNHANLQAVVTGDIA